MTFAAKAIGCCVVLVAIAAGCASRDRRAPDQVPVTYRDVRDSAGHGAHLGKVPCADCHGDRAFTPPSAGLCERCQDALGHAEALAKAERNG